MSLGTTLQTLMKKLLLHVQDRRILIQCVPSISWSSAWHHASEDSGLIFTAVRKSSLTKFDSFFYNPNDMLFFSGSSVPQFLQLQKRPQHHLLISKAYSIATLCLSLQSSTSFSSLLLFLTDRKQTRGFLFVVRLVQIQTSSITLQKPFVLYIQDGRKITLQMPHLIFIQQISVLNILNMLYNLHFFLFKMPFIS